MQGCQLASTPEFWQAVQALGDCYDYPPTEMAGMPTPPRTERTRSARPGTRQKCERMYAGGAGSGISPTADEPHCWLVVVPLANRTFHVPETGFQ